MLVQATAFRRADRDVIDWLRETPADRWQTYNIRAIDTVGVDHVVYGSDFPPVPIPLKRSVDVVNELKISNEDKQKILGGTAAMLLGLSG